MLLIFSQFHRVLFFRESDAVLLLPGSCLPYSLLHTPPTLTPQPHMDSHPKHNYTHTHRHTLTGTHIHRLQPWVHTLNYTSTKLYFGPWGNCFLLLEPCTPNLSTFWTTHPSNFILTIKGSMNTSLNTPTSNRINRFLSLFFLTYFCCTYHIL